MVCIETMPSQMFYLKLGQLPSNEITEQVWNQKVKKAHMHNSVAHILKYVQVFAHLNLLGTPSLQ